MKKGSSSSSSSSSSSVMDGSEIMELVGNKQVFSNYVDDNFEKLDRDRDGKLSVKELEPAVADIGAAMGLPSQGTCAHSDRIYSEVLKEFTHGKEDKVSKTEFKVVLSDILLGVAAGLNRDPVVILRMDGQDLLDFIDSSSFEMDMIGIFGRIDLSEGSLQDYITKALEQLTVDQGMPPFSDHWVKTNIVEPPLQLCLIGDQGAPISQEHFLQEFKKVAKSIAQNLQDQPVIVAHTENTFDGRGIKKMFSNKFELDKLLDATTKELRKDRHKKLSKECLRVALDTMAPSAGLPPYGAIEQMDKVMNDVIKMVNADDGKFIKQDEFKKLMTEILGSLMLQLQGNPISVSSSSVVHEPNRVSSSLFTPTFSST